MKRDGKYIYEPLDYTYDPKKFTIYASKKFSDTDVGEYLIDIIIPGNYRNYRNYFTVDSPYNDTYNANDEIPIYYDTTFKNNTTGDETTKVAHETFYPLTADYSWTLSNGLAGTFHVTYSDATLMRVSSQSVSSDRIGNVKVVKSTVLIPVYSSSWAQSTEFYQLKLHFNTIYNGQQYDWHEYLESNKTNTSNYNIKNTLHMISLSTTYYQGLVRNKIPTIDFNHDVICYLDYAGFVYKLDLVQESYVTCRPIQEFNIRN
jgi:hypothetical protein